MTETPNAVPIYSAVDSLKYIAEKHADGGLDIVLAELTERLCPPGKCVLDADQLLEIVPTQLHAVEIGDQPW